MNNGSYIVGTLSGTDTNDWTDRDGQVRQNHYLILAATYQDRFGNPQTEVNRVEFAHTRLAEINKSIGEMAGEKVLVPVRVEARKGGRNGAFITYFLPTSSYPEVLEDV